VQQAKEVKMVGGRRGGGRERGRSGIGNLRYLI
jgi:hypothetical protein